MKKAIPIFILVCSVALLSQSCVKSCTCINPDTDQVTDLNIDPSESCSDHSSATLGNCS